MKSKIGFTVLFLLVICLALVNYLLSYIPK